MKKFAIALCALTLGTVTAALAADLPARTYGKAPSLPVVAAYDWSGFYIGINGGGGGGQNCFDYLSAGIGSCPNVSGGLAGGQIGYNWQTSNVVLGLEFSGDWANLTGSSVMPLAACCANNSHISSIFMGTARAGYAWDRSLLYVRGGLAWVRGNYGLTCTGVIGGGVCTSTGATVVRSSETRFGGVVGAGFEYAVTDNLILGVEGDYLPLGTKNNAFNPRATFDCGGGGPGLPCTVAVKEDLWTVTGRLSWKFSAPAVAKY